MPTKLVDRKPTTLSTQGETTFFCFIYLSISIIYFYYYILFLYFILYSKTFWQDPLFKITFHSLLTILKNTSSFTYKSLARSIVLKCSIISIQPGSGLRSFINFGSKSLKIVRSSNLLTLLSGT